jgi:2'-5' RNA ligase
MTRLFIGLEIPQQIITDLAPVRGGVESAHWQRDNQLHLTLAFIGETPPKTQHEIESALARIHFDVFDLSLWGVGFFGKPKLPKSLWAGVEDKKPIVHLYEKVIAALDRIEIETERRKFKPHVTLARFRRRAQARIGDWLTNNEVLHTRRVQIDRFVLFSSERTSEGSFFRQEAIYTANGCTFIEDEATTAYDKVEYPTFGIV